jgi:hypothetical protein
MSMISKSLEEAEFLEPYAEKNLANVLDSIVAGILNFIVIPKTKDEEVPHSYIALALWVVHSYVFAAFETTPYLHISSATMQSGKTLLLEVLEKLCSIPWLFSSVTVAAISRKIDQDKPTILYDEGDAANKELMDELRGIFNSGYKKSGKRSVVGAGMSVQDLDVYCPKAFAGIGKGSLQETLRDRSIPIVLKRKTKNEKAERGRQRNLERVFKDSRNYLIDWASKLDLDDLGSKEPEQPDELSDRQQDFWEPLFVIADAAGGDWPALARKAAVAIHTSTVDELDRNTRLLADMYNCFKDKGVDRVATNDALRYLNALEDSPWQTVRNGHSLIANGLAYRLSKFDVKPKTIRFGESAVFKGYERKDFEDVWARYIPDKLDGGTSTPLDRYTVTSSLPSPSRPAETAATENVTVQSGTDANDKYMWEPPEGDDDSFII